MSAGVAEGVRLEYAKSRRRKLGVVGLVVVAAAVLFASAGLFTASSQKSFVDPTATPWLQLLLTVALVTALTSPLLVAILASRMVDIEHGSGGWILARMTGCRRGDLCRVKVLALAPLLAVLVAAQFVVQVLIGRAAGIQTPPDLGRWAGYAVSVFLVGLALLGLHVCLAAWTENQLLGLGVGVVGSFVGLFSLFMPPFAAKLLPWGYYAVTCPVAMIDNQKLVAAQPDLVAFADFLLVCAATFWLATSALNRKDV